MEKPQPLTDAEAFAWLQNHTTYPKDIIIKKEKTVSELLIEAIESWITESHKLRKTDELEECQHIHSPDQDCKYCGAKP